MSTRITTKKGSIVLIHEEPENKCQECGKVKELRPYGEGGKMICYDCGMKNPKLTEKMCHEHLFGDHKVNSN